MLWNDDINTILLHSYWKSKLKPSIVFIVKIVLNCLLTFILCNFH